jgi:hypothetical protein
VALTGAGISVPSGIPDFRTPGKGLWENVNPMEVAHIDAFRSDPKRFWSFYRPRLHSLDGIEPNPAHEALAELERRGLLEAVVTQNIDTLHHKAGSERVIEVHGSIRTASCQACDARYELAAVEGHIDEDGVAVCAACTSLVKPDVPGRDRHPGSDALRRRRGGEAGRRRRRGAHRGPGRGLAVSAAPRQPPADSSEPREAAGRGRAGDTRGGRGGADSSR